MNNTNSPPHLPSPFPSPSPAPVPRSTLSNEAIISLVGVLVTVFVPIFGFILRRQISRFLKRSKDKVLDIELIPIFMAGENYQDPQDPSPTSDWVHYFRDQSPRSDGDRLELRCE
ncbi:uncharacterized protein J3D65DRAFT_672221 [Phyllosticta citribraziliensis]|uniref:Uncharacterized protein n=1 Tax=Phyllosticta citribraziliensis TaxID=989973 RepID=A0ABR1L546_9PEZI